MRDSFAMYLSGAESIVKFNRNKLRRDFIIIRGKAPYFRKDLVRDRRTGCVLVA